MKNAKPPKGWKPPGKPIPRHLRPTTWHSSSSTAVAPPPIDYSESLQERNRALRLALMFAPEKGPTNGR